MKYFVLIVTVIIVVTICVLVHKFRNKNIHYSPTPDTKENKPDSPEQAAISESKKSRKGFESYEKKPDPLKK